MYCSGIDLAAAPANTGAATLEVTPRGLSLIDVTSGASDTDISARISNSDVTGLDVPLGWPRAFRRFVEKHAARVLEAREVGPSERRELANRYTDLRVREMVGAVPLPVAAERIAYPAMRWAGIEAQLRTMLPPGALDRAESGRIAEVYPAAALKAWGLPHRGYKGVDSQGRVAIMDSLADLFGLDLGGHRVLLESNADCLDAVIAAIVASEIRAGRCVPPPREYSELVAEEGWVWVPYLPSSLRRA